MSLNKTDILAGLQCEKHLFLRKNHPERAKINDSPAAVTGRVVQEHARREFPDGVLVERHHRDVDPLTQTRQLMQDSSIQTIFEAGFRYQDDQETLEVFVDVMERTKQGWVLTEIKSGTRVQDKHIDDVTIQALILARSGIPITRYNLMHINPDFRYQGDHDYSQLFLREDITDSVRAHLADIASRLSDLELLVSAQEPVKQIGSHCKNPFPCPFMRYCESIGPRYPVYGLPNGADAARKLIGQGIIDIRDIPPDFLTSETQQRVRNITIQGQAELLPGAKQILAGIEYPRYYLDFECIQFAIPIWKNTRPYDQLPFQWSCHIESADGKLLHAEFLDVSGDDPRRAFAKSLLEVCATQGPIIVYNQAFEKRIIRELARMFPDLSDALYALNERIFDLLPVVRKNYYHPDMKGSWSIKKVLPCLVPELRYESLGTVQDGTMAQAVYLDIISGKRSGNECEKLKKDLLAYCALDTLAMVRIVEKMIQ